MIFSHDQIKTLTNQLIIKFRHSVNFLVLPHDELTSFTHAVMDHLNSGISLSSSQLDKKSEGWRSLCPTIRIENESKLNELYPSIIATAVWFHYHLQSEKSHLETYSVERLFEEHQREEGFQGLDLGRDRTELELLQRAHTYVAILAQLLSNSALGLGMALKVLERLEATWIGTTGTGEKKEVKQRRAIIQRFLKKKNTSQTSSQTSSHSSPKSTKKRSRKEVRVQSFDDADNSSVSSTGSLKRIKDNQGAAVPVDDLSLSVFAYHDLEEFEKDDFDFLIESFTNSDRYLSATDLAIVFERFD